MRNHNIYCSHRGDCREEKHEWIEFDLPNLWFALRISMPMIWVDEYKKTGYRGWKPDGVPRITDFEFDPMPDSDDAEFSREQIRSWKNSDVSDLPDTVLNRIQEEMTW